MLRNGKFYFIYPLHVLQYNFQPLLWGRQLEGTATQDTALRFLFHADLLGSSPGRKQVGAQYILKCSNTKFLLTSWRPSNHSTTFDTVAVRVDIPCDVLIILSQLLQPSQEDAMILFSSEKRNTAFQLRILTKIDLNITK